MEEPKRLRITCDGESITIEAFGFKGKACQQVTDAFLDRLQAIGLKIDPSKTKIQFKDEYYAEPVAEKEKEAMKW